LKEAQTLAPAMKVIVMSGLPKDFATQALRQEEIPFFLQKPFPGSTLVNLIGHVLQHSADRSEGIADPQSATLPRRGDPRATRRWRPRR
jgi:hypothetical protein